MNEPISNNPDERGLLPYPVILAATKGDPEAMKIVVQHYASYIAYLSTRKVRDEYGNVYYGIDEDMRDRLQAKLMRAVLDYKIDGHSMWTFPFPFHIFRLSQHLDKESGAR